MEFERGVQRIFLTVIFGSSGNKRNRFALCSIGGEEGSGVEVAKILLSFKNKC